MMRIIKKGKRFEEFFTCPACGAEFSTDEYRIVEDPIFVDEDVLERFAYKISCPACKAPVKKPYPDKDRLEGIYE